MAQGAVIGALRVILGADTAAFETGLKGAQTSLNTFGSSFNKIAATLGITAAATKFAYDIEQHDRPRRRARQGVAKIRRWR